MPEDHFRAKARPELRVRVRWRRLDEPHTQEVEARTLNIGIGGAFILADVPPPIGTPIEVAISSPATWEPVRVVGEVRWIAPGGPDEEPGMGVAFQNVPARDMVALHDFFVSLHFGPET